MFFVVTCIHRTTGSGGGVRSVSVPQVLSMLTWLILAAMRVQAIVDTVTVNDTSVTTFLGIQHTSTHILYLLDPSDQERFVKMIPTIVMEALMNLVINDNRQDAQAVFVFVQVCSPREYQSEICGLVCTMYCMCYMCVCICICTCICIYMYMIVYSICNCHLVGIFTKENSEISFKATISGF